jgi:hypothetical protein
LSAKSNFSVPKIYTAKGDLSKRWYVNFSFRNPETNKKEHSPQNNGLFTMVDFKYDKTKDTNTFPTDQVLNTNGTVYDKTGHMVKNYKNRQAGKIWPVRHL